MIDQASAPHKYAPSRLLAALLLLGGLPGLVGCGSSGGDESGSSAASASRSCDVAAHVAPWEMFRDFCEATESGHPPTRQQLEAFPELPSVVAWRESQKAKVRSGHMVNWLEFTFSPQRLGKKNVHTRNRAVFSRNYTYSLEHRADIQEKLDAFLAENLACTVKKEAGYWLKPEQRPASLDIVFLPSKPELRYDGDRLFVDTAVLAAGSNPQLVRQLIGLIFRTRGFLEGPVPTGLDGEEAVAHSIRTMMNEGIRGYIEQLPYTYFQQDHPKLGEVNIVPENVFLNGREAIDLLNKYLPLEEDDPQAAVTMGGNLAMTLLASGSLNQGGYSMAACIVKNLGRDSLRDTVGNPAGFLKAYQEAALRNPTPTPDPYSVPDALTSSMPPLDEDALADLLRICELIIPPTP